MEEYTIKSGILQPIMKTFPPALAHMWAVFDAHVESIWVSFEEARSTGLPVGTNKDGIVTKGYKLEAGI